MLNKIKNFISNFKISNFKREIAYAICLEDMKAQGKAKCKSCNGYIDEQCLECPYFRDRKR